MMVAEVPAFPIRCVRIGWLLVLVSIVMAAPCAEAQRTEAAARGRNLYVSGTHADGRTLVAHNEATDLPLPPAFVACANCHGYEARGRTEGGITTSDIRWDILTKPYEILRTDGRRRAPYDASTFLTALTKGVDPGGQALDSAMPRFALSTGDAADLIAYLKHLDNPGDHGVSDDAVRIGVMASRDSAGRAIAESDRWLLACWFDGINDRGGIFRRRVELVPMTPETVGSMPAILAVLAISADEGRGSDVNAPPGIPVLSAIADSLTENDRYRFALYPGTIERARVLARYAIARDSSSHPKLALLYSENTTSSALLAAMIAALQPMAVLHPIALTSSRSNEVVGILRADGVRNVLLLDSGDAAEALVASALRRDWDPLFLWTGHPRNVMEGVRAVTIEPALTADVTAEAGASYARCVDPAATNARNRSRQFALLASARLLLTALEQGGRDIGRERLVETLESLRELRSGFAPPGSLTPRRHTAASGVYVVPVPGSGFETEPMWMMLD
jgi:mono/diheme cytochrome c family protein